MKTTKIIYILKPYFEKLEFIDFSLIFGSFALGKNHDISDLDIAVHTEKDLSLIEIGGIVSDIEMASGINTDLIILNNLYKTKPEFAYNIVKDSIPIITNKKDELINFKKNTYLYYLDTEYLRKMVYAGLNKRIENKRFGDSNYAG